MNWLFTSGRQNIGTLASAWVLLMNIQDWFTLVLIGLISLLSKGLSRVFYSTTVWKHTFFSVQPSWGSNSYISMVTTGKTIALSIWTFACKVISLLFNMLSRFVIAFLPRNRHQFHNPNPDPNPICSDILAQENKISHSFHFSPSICHEAKGQGAMILVFECWGFFLCVVNFVIHWNETAMGLHVFPIPIPPPTSLSTRSL